MSPKSAPERRPSIGVVIPVRNGINTVLACLDAVLDAARHSRSPITVILVDNGSRDGTVREVRDRYHDWITVLEDPVRTVGALRNLGAAHHRTDLLSFVDADCVVCPDYFTIAANALESSRADAVGYPYALPSNPKWIERAWDELHRPPAAGPAEWLYAGNFIIRREAFARVAGFSESRPTGEDPELGRRLRQAGFTLHTDPALVSVHLGNPKTIAAFFRQQWWHGLGALEGGIGVWRNRPLIMTLLHLLATIAPVLGAAAGVTRSPIAIMAGLTLSQALVPLASVLYRMSQTRRWRNPIPGIILYWLYYWARLTALASITLGVPKPPPGRS
jgi:glycosyltransferase involved in cell wall biosynthesis